MAEQTCLVIPDERIQQCIYLIRKQKVMLDKDLASLYGVKPIALRQQVKRNIERFPSDFMYQLTDKEVTVLLSQNVIPSRKYIIAEEAKPNPNPIPWVIIYYIGKWIMNRNPKRKDGTHDRRTSPGKITTC